MKKLTFALLFVSVVAFSGCGASEGDSQTNSNTAPAQNQNTAPAQDNAPSIQVSPDNQQNTNASTGSGEVKLNPPHGEPGHRCEIAVGAPLPND